MDELQPLAALVSQQAADLEVYAGFLFAALDGALPAELVQVERRPRCPTGCAAGTARWSRCRSASAISVSPCSGSRSAHRPRPAWRTRSAASCCPAGPLSLAEWSTALTQALYQLAEHNAGAAAALQRLTSFTV